MTTKLKPKKRFPKRVVLGVGYPWSPGSGPPMTMSLSLSRWLVGGQNVELRLPEELESDDCPRYRLVLERVEARR